MFFFRRDQVEGQVNYPEGAVSDAPSPNAVEEEELKERQSSKLSFGSETLRYGVANEGRGNLEVTEGTE